MSSQLDSLGSDNNVHGDGGDGGVIRRVLLVKVVSTVNLYVGNILLHVALARSHKIKATDTVTISTGPCDHNK